MPEPRYHIVFSTLVEGRYPGRVYHDLAEVFKIDQALVRQIFACQGAVVKSDLDREAAEQYLQVILAAGAICVIEPMPSVPAAVSDSGTQEDSSTSTPSQVPEEDDESCAIDQEMVSQQRESEFDTETDAGRETLGFRDPVFAALLLFAGACLPVMSDSGQLHWPWVFAFEPQPPGLLWWVMLPVAAAFVLVLLRAPASSLMVVLTGVVTLLGTIVVLWEAALILPLRILPLDRSVALLCVLPLLGAPVCSAACRAMNELGELITLRLLAVCGSLAILLPVFAAFFSAAAIWGRWPLILLLLLLLLYAVLTLVCACLPAVPENFLNQVRLLGLFLLCWAPVAVFLAHLPLPAPGIGSALLLGVLKSGLLYYGALSAIAVGLRNEFLYRFEK